jgi:hypothetical protein
MAKVADQRELVNLIFIIRASDELLVLIKSVVAAMLKEPLVNGQRLRFGMAIKSL